MKTRLISLAAFLVVMISSIVFYQYWIAEYTNYIENVMAFGTAVLASVLFLTAFFLPRHLSLIKGLVFTLFLAVLLASIIFWLVRPYQIIYSVVPERMNVLEQHLQEEFPERNWEIEQSTAGEDPVFLFLVTFEDESEYEYRYLIDEDTAEGKEPVESIGQQPAD